MYHQVCEKLLNQQYAYKIYNMDYCNFNLQEIYLQYVIPVFISFPIDILVLQIHLFVKTALYHRNNTITLKALKTFLQMYCTDTCTTHVDYFNCCSLPCYYDVTHICLEYKLFINWNILLNLWNEYECFLLATIVHKEKQTVLRYIK